MTDERPTVQRGGGSSGTGGLVVGALVFSLVEIAIVGVLLLLPVLRGEALAPWRIATVAILLVVTGAAFAVFLLRRPGARWRWDSERRWGRR